MNFLIGQLVGIILGIISSWLFLYTLVLTKPKFAISPIVAYDKPYNQLHIRVLNKGRQYISDVTVSLFIAEETKEGKSVRLYAPKLNADTYIGMSPLQFWRKRWTLPTAIAVKAENADEILRILDDQPDTDRRIVFTITGVDVRSGSKSIERVTFTKDKILEGKFKAYTIKEIEPSCTGQQVNKV